IRSASWEAASMTGTCGTSRSRPRSRVPRTVRASRSSPMGAAYCRSGIRRALRQDHFEIRPVERIAALFDQPSELRLVDEVLVEGDLFQTGDLPVLLALDGGDVLARLQEAL